MEVRPCLRASAILACTIAAFAFSPKVDAAPRPPKGHASVGKKKKPSLPTRKPRRRSDAVFPESVENTPAYRYAQMDGASCHAELSTRGLELRREDAGNWPGILTPVRLQSPLEGIVFRTDLGRTGSHFELMDCRLVLALHDFAKLLYEAGIREVVFSSAYRPPPKSFPSDGVAKRHAAGLAIDVHRFRREDGSWVKVVDDFHGQLGRRVCGKSAPKPTPCTKEAELLRQLVCGAAEQHLFQ